MKKINAASHLTDREYVLFLNTYTRHLYTVGDDMKLKMTLDDVVKVEKNQEDKCLNVHYRHGEWWKYYANGTWG